MVEVHAIGGRIVCSGRQLRRREAGWEAAGSERTARRMTNPFRRRVAASLLGLAKPGKPTGRAEVTDKATFGMHDVVGGGMSGRQSGVSEETCLACERRAGVRARIILLRR